MKSIVRWGILGTGRIAKAYAEGLKNTRNGKLVAIASRNRETAELFAQEWEIENAYCSYEELAKSPLIDAVYVATPHTEHAKNAILCMNAGKAVLCEKPIAVNAKEVAKMISAARQNNVLLMEGMWSRFPPLMDEVRRMIAEKEIGEIRTIHADFGFRPEVKEPNSRLFNPELAGGSLLDVGIYPISLSFMLNGSPSSFISDWTVGETGVDEQASVMFKYNNGSMAILHSSLESETGQEAFISGTEGSIRIHKQCWKPQIMTVTDWRSGKTKKVEFPFQGNGFNYEAEHFSGLLLKGEKESPIMPLEESLKIITTIDEIRLKWGLSYPFE